MIIFKSLKTKTFTFLLYICTTERETFIFQAISMAVQRGNVQSVQGAYGESAFEELDEIFYILQPNCIF